MKRSIRISGKIKGREALFIRIFDTREKNITNAAQELQVEDVYQDVLISKNDL